MCLPAAHETVQTWIQGFGLSRMPLDDLDMACKELRLLIFPGTQVLQKQLLPPLPPTAAPQIHLAPQTEGLAPSQDAQPESALQASSPASISHAGMPEISSNTQLSAAPEPDAGKAGVAETALRPQSSALVAQHITQDAQLTTYTQPDAQMVVHANSVAAPAPSPEHQSNAATWVLGNPPEGQQAELLPSESAAPVEDHGPNHMASEQVTHDEAEQPNAALPVLGTCQKMQQPEAPFTDLAAPAQQQTPRVLDAGQASVMEAEQASPAAAQSLPPMEVDQTSAGDTEQAAGLASAAHSDTVATVHASPDSDGQPFVSNVVRDSTQV